MRTIREEVECPVNKKNAHYLYSKYMTMTLEARLKGDRALFDNYYQCAEGYLRLMNKLNNWPTPHLPFKESFPPCKRKNPK